MQILVMRLNRKCPLAWSRPGQANFFEGACQIVHWVRR